MNRIDEIKEVHESVKRIKLMSGMSGVIDLIDELMSEAERLTAELQQRENDQINAEMNLEHQSAEIDRLTAERDVWGGNSCMGEVKRNVPKPVNDAIKELRQSAIYKGQLELTRAVTGFLHAWDKWQGSDRK